MLVTFPVIAIMIAIVIVPVMLSGLTLIVFVTVFGLMPALIPIPVSIMIPVVVTIFVVMLIFATSSGTGADAYFRSQISVGVIDKRKRIGAGARNQFIQVVDCNGRAGGVDRFIGTIAREIIDVGKGLGRCAAQVGRCELTSQIIAKSERIRRVRLLTPRQNLAFGVIRIIELRKDRTTRT